MTHTVTSRSSTGTHPPLWPGILSVLFVACSVVLAARDPFGWSPLVLHLVGWLCGAFIPMVLLVAFRLRVRTLRTGTNFEFARSTGVVVTTMLALGVAVGVYHGWYIASWIAS